MAIFEAFFYFVLLVSLVFKLSETSEKREKRGGFERCEKSKVLVSAK